MPTTATLHKLRIDFNSSLRSLNLEWNKYSPIRGPSISGRYSHSSCVHRNLMYIFGGCTSGNTTFNDLWTFDLERRCWIRPLTSGIYPPPKACASLARFGQKLILFGGWTHSAPFHRDRTWKFFNQMHEFDLEKHRWTCVDTAGECPPALAGHCATIVGNKMLVFGGLCNVVGAYNHYHSMNEIWLFDFQSGTWTRKRTVGVSQPPPRYGHSQILLDEQNLLVLGGCGGPSIALNDIWLLRMGADEGWKWQRVRILGKDLHSFPLFGFNPVVRFENTLLFMTKSTGKLPFIDSSKLLQINRRRPHPPAPPPPHRPALSFQFQNGPSGEYGLNLPPYHHHQHLVPGPAAVAVAIAAAMVASNSSNNNGPPPRLQPQPTPAERKSNFLAALQLNQNQSNQTKVGESVGSSSSDTESTKSTSSSSSSSLSDRQSDQSPRKVKNLQTSAAIRLSTIRNEYSHRVQNPMQLHLLDITRIGQDASVQWLSQARKLEGPEEIFHYTLVAATNELIMFGGVEKSYSSFVSVFGQEHTPDIVSNNVYVASARHSVI